MSTSKKTIISLVLVFLLIPFSVFAQSSVVIPLEIELQDLREVDRRLQELELLRLKSKEQAVTIVELEKSLLIEKKINDLNERELYLQKKIIEVKDMEIAGLNRNFDQMKEVADRSLKLAETVKPKSNWELFGALGLVAIIVTVIASVL